MILIGETKKIALQPKNPTFKVQYHNRKNLLNPKT